MPGPTPRDQDTRLEGYRSKLVTRESKPRELLFEFVDATERRYRCELLDHGDWGVEAQIATVDFGYFAARRCPSREVAELWARQRRRTLEGDAH
jgi:hypothetical protein